MDWSASPTHGEQETRVWNGYYEYTQYHPLSSSTYSQPIQWANSAFLVLPDSTTVRILGLAHSEVDT
jgi:hypothetical protein